MSDKFKVGDLVQLKSGGAPMTVGYVSDGKVLAHWTNDAFASCALHRDECCFVAADTSEQKAPKSRTLVKLPACSPEGKFELISPAAVAAIVACSDDSRCLVQLRGHSEEGGYLIQLSSQETADRLGITVVDRVEP